MPTTIANSSSQRQLEKIHQEFLGLLAKENSLRAERNEATRLAKAGGISRELLHRIIRAKPLTQPEVSVVIGVTGEGDFVEALAAAQKSLDAAASKRAALEVRRAAAIRLAVQGAGVTRTEIARLAGVSSETVRKVCLGI